jgi:hypothetical protein
VTVRVARLTAFSEASDANAISPAKKPAISSMIAGGICVFREVPYFEEYLSVMRESGEGVTDRIQRGLGYG